MVDTPARLRRLMSCLGDPSRFHLVRQLARGERCVSDLARRIGLSQSCTTRHLQALQREQIVRGERAGKRVVFHLRLDEPQIGALIAWVMAARPGMPAGFRATRTRGSSAPSRKGVRPPGPERVPATLPVPAVSRTPAANPRTPGTNAPAPNPGPPAGGARAPAPDPPPVRYRAPRSELEDYLL